MESNVAAPASDDGVEGMCLEICLNDKPEQLDCYFCLIWGVGAVESVSGCSRGCL